MSIVIAVDGTAASGKGTLAKKLAAHFGFAHLDSGALYRLTALSVEFGNALAGKVKEIRRIWSLVPAAPSVEEARSALVKIHDIVHVQV